MVCLVATHTLKAAGAQQSSSVAGQLGDMDSSGTVDHSDIDPFVLGLVDPNTYVDEYGLDLNAVGDMDASGKMDNDDINPFVGLLVPAQAVPEPVTLSLLALGACLPLLRKKRT